MELRTAVGQDGLAAILAEPGRAVIGLDFDGTLAPIVADPDRARAHPGVVPALAALAPYLAGVVVVTGRPADVAVRYGGFAGLERLTVLGQYGVERWDAATGELSSPPPPPGVAGAREALPKALEGAPAGTWVEDKGRALAVHTRRTENPDAALELLRPTAEVLAAEHGLVVEPGRYVLELRPPGMDKGAALTAYLAELDAHAVLYAGDDLGDLAAYAAVERRRKDGHPGVLVCSSAVTGERQVGQLAEKADLLVPGPEGVVALLAELAGELAR